MKISIKTNRAAKTYEWHFNGSPIANKNAAYEGSATDKLSIKNFFSRQEGIYECVAKDESGEAHTSGSVTLEICKYFLTCMHA